MSITIKDVARQCGMSISTVSKVFNGYTDISRDTREQVLKIARKLGYQPNALARALKTNRSYNLGVLFIDENATGLTHPFFAVLLNGFKMEAEKRGYDITFINHNIGTTEMTYLEHCHYRNMDGVCLACVDFYSEEVVELVNSDIPSCTVDHIFPNRPCIVSDNSAGIRLLLEYVSKMGHRRIAYIHGQRNSFVTQTRLSGFRGAMRALGLPVQDDLVLEGRYTDAAVTRELMLRLLRREDRPTCVLLPDDASFFGAYEAASALGLRIPEDISVAGYDGIRLTQSIHPQLTTVFQDSERIGQLAAQQLVHHIERPSVASNDLITVPVRLIEGGTVARLS